MSFYHENIVWQSADGTWNVGFYDRISGGGGFDSPLDIDYDAEWDDTYDYDSFQFVSIGHKTPEDAMNAWGGANPGFYDVQSFSEANRRSIEKYEDMAARKYEAEGSSTESYLYGKGSAGYYGPPKQRTLKAIKQQRDALVEGWAHYQLGNYANRIDDQALKALDDRIATMLPEATDDQVAAFETEDAAHRQRLQDKLDSVMQRRRSQMRLPWHLRNREDNTAIDAVTNEIRASERAAKQRAKQRKHPAKTTPTPRGTPQHSTSRGPKVCGRPTRAGTPCQRSANCPVHR